MALHALAYCERLYYLEEIEEIRVADERVYSGRTMHEAEVDKAREWRSIELASEKWGIRGKVDFARYRDGKFIAVEHKKGRSKGDEAWQTDKLQITAYAVLLSEHFSKEIEEGRIRYHANNKTIRVTINDAAKETLRKAIARAQELSLSVERPPVTENENLCTKCSLAPVCLPEEERFAKTDEKKKPRLYFPPNDERRTIHLVDDGCQMRRAGLQFVVHYPDNRDNIKIPSGDVGAIVLHGGAQITSQAIRFAAFENIAVHWLSGGGWYVGGLTPAAGVQRRLRQYSALTDKHFCFALSVRLAVAKMENQLAFISRSARSREYIEEINTDIKAMQALIRNAKQTKDADTLRGYEGNAARHYFTALSQLIDKEIELMMFSGRNRRPPRDCFNAALSFGYSLLLRDVMAAIIVTGLDSTLGFYHTPRSAAHPLALDLMELFRVIIWDMALLASVNRRQWSEKHFVQTKNLVWLSDEGKRQAINIYENRKKEAWKHPVLKYSLSYARTMELEARLLEKEWTGDAGLFARLRLR